MFIHVYRPLRQIIASSQDFKRGFWRGARVKVLRKRSSSSIEADELYAVLEQFHFGWCWVHLEKSGERIKCRFSRLRLCEQVLSYWVLKLCSNDASTLYA